MLLTRSRLCPGASPGSSLHLHVLSTPPAFVLSQDQTLREELLLTNEFCRAPHEGRPYTEANPGASTGYCLLRFLACRRADRHEGGAPAPGSNLDAHLLGQVCQADSVRMLLSFQRPSRPLGPEGNPLAWRVLGSPRAGNGV